MPFKVCFGCLECFFLLTYLPHYKMTWIDSSVFPRWGPHICYSSCPLFIQHGPPCQKRGLHLHLLNSDLIPWLLWPTEQSTKQISWLSSLGHSSHDHMTLLLYIPFRIQLVYCAKAEDREKLHIESSYYWIQSLTQWPRMWGKNPPDNFSLGPFESSLKSSRWWSYISMCRNETVFSALLSYIWPTKLMIPYGKRALIICISFNDGF